MRLPRFIISEKDISWSDACSFSVSLNANDKHHLLNVLRKKPGDTLSLFVQDQRLELIAKISSTTKDSLKLALVEKNEKDISHHLILLIGLTKASTVDFICEKLAELGASEIHFFRAERSQYSLEGAERQKRLSRLERIIETAEKQSGSVVNTSVQIHSGLADLLSTLEKQSKVDCRLCLSTKNKENIPKINDFFAERSKNTTQSTALLIGCEGGFTETEAGLAKSHGFIEVSLGENILRTETAALLACAIAGLYSS